MTPLSMVGKSVLRRDARTKVLGREELTIPDVNVREARRLARLRMISQQRE